MHDEGIKKAFEDYRRQKRRHYFMVKAAIAKRLNASGGDLRPALKRGEDVARSSGVAPLAVGAPKGAVPPLRGTEAKPPITGIPQAVPQGEGETDLSR